MVAKGDGPINIDHLHEGFTASRAAAAEHSATERRKKMSPAGALGLPPLLDQRRLEIGITDGYFRMKMSFSNISLYQLPPFMHGELVSKDSMILVPETAAERERLQAPRGVLLDAGLSAMDVLTTNGYMLGDIVYFVRMSPWEVSVDIVAGREERMVVMPVGSLVSSEDLARRLQAGEVKVVYDEHDHEHQIHDTETGRMWVPRKPKTAPEM